MSLSFNKRSISALAAPIYQAIEKIVGENSNYSFQLQVELRLASFIPYHVFISCAVHRYNKTAYNRM